MSGLLAIRNRQRTRAVDTRMLRRITRHLLETEWEREDYELCVHLIAVPEMTRLNERYLRHPGSTDILTFDHSDGAERRLAGELFISIEDAVRQARQFRTTWPSELARYLVHGLLHLRGYDDVEPAARRVMKREENRLLKTVTRQFDLKRLAGGKRFQRRVEGRDGTGCCWRDWTSARDA